MTREFDLGASLASGVEGRSGAWAFVTAVLARGRTAEAVGRVRDLVPGDWLNDCR
ncbi:MULTISPECIES: hypothetical protein [unclassified Streptomyces]|uniref:hypothetical protein n=1 Tax=unclassified Streptomyces TaxID=2593676 RepID=UPI00344F6571